MFLKGRELTLPQNRFCFVGQLFQYLQKLFCHLHRIKFLECFIFLFFGNIIQNIIEL